MDVFSHGLWAGALFKLLNLKIKANKKFKFWAAVFWGAFPDLFAFTIPFFLMFFYALTGQINFANMPHPSAMEPSMPSQLASLFNLSNILYNLSHSLIVFLLVFGLVYLAFKKPKWVLGAWLLHILIDIPTHSYKFYPTPIFWPLSGWKFDGFGWANEWFLIIDAVLLIAAYAYLFWREKRGK